VFQPDDDREAGECLGRVVETHSFPRASFPPNVQLFPREISEEDFSEDAAIEERLRFMLGCAILAPFGHNTQLWNFKIENDTVKIFPDYGRRLSLVDPYDRVR